ncbi:hypothetical protein NHX12_021884 [Muraenolepis orangiensis]|uniref:Uncharacterized protein n=1 Tax=Muraenolepis orangiensis TaxID=630683 RepID=A0A9Q0ERC6_9TELE|nr:hypothetical protein NHX12_021884 [Muraenolepis orangiensis]
MIQISPCTSGTRLHPQTGPCLAYSGPFPHALTQVSSYMPHPPPYPIPSPVVPPGPRASENAPRSTERAGSIRSTSRLSRACAKRIKDGDRSALPPPAIWTGVDLKTASERGKEIAECLQFKMWHICIRMRLLNIGYCVPKGYFP